MLGLAVLKRKPGRGLAEPNDVKICEIENQHKPTWRCLLPDRVPFGLLASLKAEPVLYFHAQDVDGRVSSSRDIPY